MELILQIAQFILAISILVILHELGHFIPAKLFKTKVEKFYLFFDPWFSLAKKKVGETEYGIGWIPMGGYVKIAGMIDESMDTEQMKQPAQPWEFRSKPAWQRLIIMLGGVTINFFLAWFLFSCLSFFNGEKYHDLAKFNNGIFASEEGIKMGLKTGDKIIKIDGKPAERMEPSMINMLLSNEITVLREGKEFTFKPNEEGIAAILKTKGGAKMYYSNRFSAVVDTLTNGMAKQAGLQKGDEIIALNGQTIQYYDQFLDGMKNKINAPVSIDVLRNNELKRFNMTTDAKGKIGFGADMKLAQKDFENTTTVKHYNFGEAIPRGFTRTIDVLVMQVKQFKLMFSSKIQGYKSVGGPIAIVKMMPVEKNAQNQLSINWDAFWSFTALFSVWLAFLNLLPIPGLDGGHVVFTLWEMITGKPATQKVLEVAQTIGVIFLLGLMVLIFGSDIYKVITGKI